MSELPPPPGAGSTPTAGITPTPPSALATPPPPRTDTYGSSRGPVRLEPHGVGQIIDAAIRLYRSRWKTIMGLTAVIIVPFTLLEHYSIHVTRHQVLIGRQVYENQPNTAVTIAFTLAGFLVIQPLLQASLIKAIAGIYLGQAVTWKESIRFGWSKAGWVLWMTFVAGLLTLLGVLGLLIGAVFIYVKLYFVTSAVVIEDARGSALSRSWNLTKGRWWPIFGTLILASIIAGIASAILTIPAAIISATDTGDTMAWLFSAVLNSAASVIVTPFTIAVTVLLYFDARIRREAFDLAVMAREVGAGAQ
jgi:hypothetical protein